jgi:hypothetical protein
MRRGKAFGLLMAALALGGCLSGGGEEVPKEAWRGDAKVLTVKGALDPRLKLSFLVTYRPRGDDRTCGDHLDVSTGLRRASLKEEIVRVRSDEKGHYEVAIPLRAKEGSQKCPYELVGVSVRVSCAMKKLEGRYAEFPVLTDTPILMNMHEGPSSMNLPGQFARSKERFYRIPEKSRVSCRTERFIKGGKTIGVSFICELDKAGEVEGLERFPENETVHIDFTVDDKASARYEYAKRYPEPFCTVK